ncbi:hypothetical protein KCU87_g447, partial [Aureobasidium melanogenum]
MTTHWSGTNNTFPLPSISTSTPMPSPISTYPCFFCDNAFYNIRELASHLITSHGPNLHSALCPRAADDSLRKSVAAFLNEFAASGAAFVSLCDCFPGHPAHTQTTTPSTTHMLNGLETTSPNTSAYASSMLFSPPPCTFIWPSLQPTNPTAIADGHYTAFYTNAAWISLQPPRVMSFLLVKELLKLLLLLENLLFLFWAKEKEVLMILVSAPLFLVRLPLLPPTSPPKFLNS